MKKMKDFFILSSGKRIDANKEIIGLAHYQEEEGYVWSVCEGYDGVIQHKKLTKDEQLELANYMIDLWKKFKSEI